MGSGTSTLSPVDQLEKEWNAEGTDHDALRRELQKCNVFMKRKNLENSVSVIPDNIVQDNAKLEELWKVCDYNGNNMTSLAELDKMIQESFPAFDNKPAIMRAYMACDLNRNGFISKDEFKNFFGYLDYFTKLWMKFERMDADGDRRISFQEMKELSKEIFGVHLNQREASIMFNTMDRNNGGQILFYEFCAHMAKGKWYGY